MTKFSKAGRSAYVARCRQRSFRFWGVIPWLALGALPLSAQLRPLPLVQWEEVESGYARCGLGYYDGQRASLAGISGDMLQLGECTVAFSVGGAQIRVADLVYRRLSTVTRFAEPAPDVVLQNETALRDFGDVTLETVIPVGLPGAFSGGFRFGSRIPSSDNRIGLDRDQADIHLALMAGLNTTNRGVTAEAGVGINGVRSSRNEQQDVLIYALRGWLRTPRALLHTAMLGQRFWNHPVTQRGNENLNEFRMGARTTGTWWIELEGVRGTARHSPTYGLRLGLGRTLR